MRSDLARLAGSQPDLLVIGGGIQGACIAWDAALRGLQVGLIERDRFGSGTSANSLRIVHGGLRYLARGNWRRMRESVRERSILLRIAPDLVEPLPVLVPTGQAGVAGRIAFGTALALNDWLTFGRNRQLPPRQQIGNGRLLSRRECLDLLPGFSGVTGAALWYDARLKRPEALARTFVDSAVALGAAAADQIEAEALVLEGGTVTGARVHDRATGENNVLPARAVVVAAGPWTNDFLQHVHGAPARPLRHALALNLVLGRRLADAAVGLASERSMQEDPVGGGRRLLFLVPDPEGTLLGTWYGLADAQSEAAVLERGATMLLEDVARAWPGLRIEAGDVKAMLWGRLPLKSGQESGRPEALAEYPLVWDHREHGVSNLLAVEPVKLTTARAVAERAVDRVLAMLGERYRPCRTHEISLVRSRESIIPLEPASGMSRT